MFQSLSDQQKHIVFESSGRCVVRACPGSGKTFSVAARLAHQIQNWELRTQGIAALSFTNVAWHEIEEKLRVTFNIATPLHYPHFLGTIDSFINNFIFLPFGHLVMQCGKRPTLVGEPHGAWNAGKYERDYERYFDTVSYGVNNELVFPNVNGLFHFGYTKFYKKDGSESKHAQNIREVKQKYWTLGYATQRDANHFAMRILQRFPGIARSIVLRFPSLIVDEAQDTSEVQMRVIDLLIEHGLQELLLVGDPDQAIFEWNDARPELFLEKYHNPLYTKIELNENRRSSKKICEFTFSLSTLEEPSNSVNEDVRDFPIPPEFVIYEENSIHATIEHFLELCQKNRIEINPQNVAVLGRGINFIHSVLGTKFVAPNRSPWEIGDYFTKDFAFGKYVYDNQSFRDGFHLIEKAFVKCLTKRNFCSSRDLDERIQTIGFIQHRTEVLSVIKCLPSTDQKLSEWVRLANRNFLKCKISVKLQFIRENGEISFENLFKPASPNGQGINYRLGTIHSVKGETFEAVLLFLRKKGTTKHYRTLLSSGVSSTESEDLRIVYVAMTRPRRLLVMAIPEEKDLNVWKERLFAN